MSAVKHILPFFPSIAMASEPYDGIFTAAAYAAEAEIERLEELWAAKATESEVAWAAAEAASAEVVRRRREYETAVIFLINPHKVRYTRSRNGHTYACPRYINLGPRLNWSSMAEDDRYVDSTPAPAGCYYRTAAELGLDNATATRHYEERTYIAENGDARDSSTRRASDNVVAIELLWARTIGAHTKRAHALAAFASMNL